MEKIFIVREKRIVSENDFLILQEVCDQSQQYELELCGVSGDCYKADTLSFDGKNIDTSPINIPDGFVAVILGATEQEESNKLANSIFFELWKNFYITKYKL